MTTRPDQLLEVIKPCSEIHVIPALAGFNLLNPLVSGDKYDIVGVCRQPIVAWRIETEALDEAGIRNVRFRSFCYPITSDHSINADSPTNWAIEYPDGSCNVPFDCICENAADLLDYWQGDSKPAGTQ
jgi:hypothetical protein